MSTREKKPQMEREEATTIRGDKNPVVKTLLGHMYITMTKTTMMKMNQTGLNM